MTLNRLLLRGLAVGFFLCLTSSLAFGQAKRRFVSGVGDDANPCSRTAPCKTFAGAIPKTAAEGEIDVLDPGNFAGNFGQVTITKSISIVADGVLAGVLVSGTNGIRVNAGPNDVVVLRGLTLDGLSGRGLSGIQFNSGGELHIEDCTINSFGTGIQIKPGAASQIFIKNTVVRNSDTAHGGNGNAIQVVPSGGQTHIFIQDTIVGNNAGTGISLTPTGSATVIASLDNVRIEKNSAGVVANDNVEASVRDSLSAGNGTGFLASASSGHAVINLASSMASGNPAGIHSNGANSTINLTDVTVVNNSVGLSLSGGGHIVSFGNNDITNNTTNGSPTKTIAQH
jgi:hypothetical protein